MKNVFSRVAKSTIMAGLGLSLVLQPIPWAFADPAQASGSDTPVAGESASPQYLDQLTGESRGDTKLYIIGKQDDLTTGEGAIDEQIKVSIPVAIHYVADTEGNLMGPSDDTVKFVNHTKLGTVHVSKIAVENEGDAKIVREAEVKDTNDTMSFKVQPMQGQSNEDGSSFVRGTAAEGNDTDFKKEGSVDELGNYANLEAGAAINPVNKGDWNIAQKHGALALNNLTGTIGGFGKIDPSTDYKAGVIHWTVRAGTRDDADHKDASVTIHYHANNGSNKDCVPVPDQVEEVLEVASLPEKRVRSAGMSASVADGTGVDAPSASVEANGTVITKRFKGWNTKADGSGQMVSTIANLGNAEDIAGKVFELYAIFE